MDKSNSQSQTDRKGPNSDRNTPKKDRKGIGGPKTPEGKKRSSMNALRHGMLSGALVLHNECPQQFEHFRRNYIETFEPVGFLELELLDEMVAMRWRQRRCWATETASIDLEMDRQRYEEPGELLGLDTPTCAARAIKVISNTSNELSCHSRYETRYHRMYYRALEKLLEIQKARRDGQPVVSTELSDPLPDPPQDFPNELNAPASEPETALQPLAPAAKSRKETMLDMIREVLDRIEVKKAGEKPKTVPASA